MERKLDFEEGEVILIDKPYEWTSFDAVNKLRSGLKIKKIGHAGTLDPLATGLLILCTGKMTKKIEEYQAKEKEYTGVIILGKTTPSIDLETEFDSETDTSHLTEDEVIAAARRFLGTIEQVPPIYSAIKVGGKRLYKSARKGQAVTINSRTVFIKEFVLTEVKIPSVKFKIVCSKGTYIRSIARDLGVALNVGGYLKELRRTKIGSFMIENAISPNQYIDNFRESVQ